MMSCNEEYVKESIFELWIIPLEFNPFSSVNIDKIKIDLWLNLSGIADITIIYSLKICMSIT